MYMILESPIMMTSDEIIESYCGKWVYVVKARFTHSQCFIEGMPVIIADSPCEGSEEGIYEIYRKPEYEERYHYDLVNYEPLIPSILSMEFVQ